MSGLAATAPLRDDNPEGFREGPAERQPSSHPLAGLMLVALPLAGMLVLSGALQRPLNGGASLSGELHNFTRQSNVPIALVGAGLYAAATLALLARWSRLTLPASLLPLLALNAWAVLSSLWSHDPQASLTRAFGLTGASLFALACLAVLGAGGVFAALSRFSALFLAGNAFLAVVAPGYARHGPDDFYAMHAGLLRGSYGHKNEFAVYLALAVLVLGVHGPAGMMKNPWLHKVLLAAGGLMLLASGSAKVLVAVPLAAGLAGLASRLSPGARLAGLAVLLGVGLLAGALLPLQDLWRGGLEVLGRDPTLSARTVIWGTALAAGQDDPLLGGGYAAAWDGGIGAAVQATLGFDPGHPHNGFLAVLLDLGAVGLLLALVNLAMLARCLVAVRAGDDPGAYRMLAAVWIFLVFVNLSGTYLAQSNDLFWACQIWMHALAARLGASPSRD